MCRNITTLRGLQPAATTDEIEAAARQYVRKVTGVQSLSDATREPFEAAVAEIAQITARLLEELPQRRQPCGDRAAAAPPGGPGANRPARGQESLTPQSLHLLPGKPRLDLLVEVAPRALGGHQLTMHPRGDEVVAVNAAVAESDFQHRLRGVVADVANDGRLHGNPAHSTDRVPARTRDRQPEKNGPGLPRDVRNPGPDTRGVKRKRRDLNPR